MAAEQQPPPPPPPPRRYGIGYALAPKKQRSFIQPSLVSLARARGIGLVPIDPALPLSDQGPFDAILHKLSGEPWESQIRDFAASHPSVPIVDPPEAIARLRNRVSMLQFVSDLDSPRGGPHTFGIPRQAVVLDPDALSDPPSTLHFPVIAKPMVSDGSAKSHKMALVFHREGLLNLKPPLVLQEFVNHGGVIFKIYVVGEYVRCVKRKSLPDLSDERVEQSEGSLSFSQVSNMTAFARFEEEYYESMHLEDAEMPPQSFITEIAGGLRRAMGLRLFNFDVIRDISVGNHYLIIDINYFPGYAKMPSYEAALTDFFWNVVHEKQMEDKSGLVLGDDDNNEKRELLCSNHRIIKEDMENVG